jgi:ribosomal protein S6--L-glutamate ligase
MAVDKYLALVRLAGAGLPVPETIACQRLGDGLAALERLGGDAVVKPIFGSEGFGITRVSDPDVAARVFAALERINGVIYLQRFIDHGGSDYRLFVLGQRVIAAMRRTHPSDWRTNVARGARGEAVRPEPALEKLALRAAVACDALIAGVDIAIDGKGNPFVLEVNAVPGWRELARVTGQDIAGEVLRFVMDLGGGRA